MLQKKGAGLSQPFFFVDYKGLVNAHSFAYRRSRAQGEAMDERVNLYDNAINITEATSRNKFVTSNFIRV